MNVNYENVSQAAEKDIKELQRNIANFKSGEMIEDKFKHYRLTRGVYGQRQKNVQMFRIKIPYGKLTAEQLVRIADIAEQYTNGNLHITTRQNIQMHHIKLEDTPDIWTLLAQKNVTAREACGNTVRNLTASADAGINPDEPFDVSPYVHASFEYFLRNPICQEMGRKIKPAFSSSEKDSAFTYFHDFGFIPRVKTDEAGEEIRGFKVVIGGGLGAQSIVAHEVYDFLHEDKIIPFMEACIRVFDRHGERAKRLKARMKFLVKKLGVDAFMELVEKEKKSLKNQTVKIDRSLVGIPNPAPQQTPPTTSPQNEEKYNQWLSTNVFEQKQKGFYAVQVRVHLGDLSAETARQVADLVKNYTADDIRLTITQGFLLKFARLEALPHIFNELDKLGLGEPGFNSTADVTACPGTDTCALGVTNSTGLAAKLESVIRAEYPQLIHEKNIHIKISGCMNSCGQHMAANIGFHGSSIRIKPNFAPAMQVVMGGGVDPEGKGFVAEKVIKLPTKRIPEALRWILADYEAHGNDGEYFNDYYYRQGKRYFYSLLTPLADKSNLTEADFQDWNQDHTYKQEIGVGECAGVSYDLISSIINDAIEKVALAEENLVLESWADSIYHSYGALVIGAKALLLSKDVHCNTHKGIIDDFQTHYVENGPLNIQPNFKDYVLRLNQYEPSEDFAKLYFNDAKAFVEQVQNIRKLQLLQDGGDKLVIDEYYKA